MKKYNTDAYESATRGLIAQLNNMGLSQSERMQAKNFVLLFRDSFKLGSVQSATFYSVIGNSYKDFPYPSYGFCKAASSAFVKLMQSKDWQLMYIDEIWTYGPHYYVQHIPTRTAFDLTFDQYAYDGVSVPYKLGKPINFSPDTLNTMHKFLDATGLDYQSLLNNKKRRAN